MATKITKSKKILLVDFETDEDHYVEEHKSVDFINISVDDDYDSDATNNDEQDNNLNPNDNENGFLDGIKDSLMTRGVSLTSTPVKAGKDDRQPLHTVTRRYSTNQAQSSSSKTPEANIPIQALNASIHAEDNATISPMASTPQKDNKENNEPILFSSCPLCLKYWFLPELQVHASRCDGGEEEEERIGGLDEEFMCGYCNQYLLPLLDISISEQEKNNHLLECREKQNKKRIQEEMLKRKKTLRSEESSSKKNKDNAAIMKINVGVKLFKMDRESVKKHIIKKTPKVNVLKSLTLLDGQWSHQN